MAVRYKLDISNVQFQVTRASQEKKDGNGRQQYTKAPESAPMWTTQVTAIDPDDPRGAEIMNITTAGMKPTVGFGALVTPVELVALPYNTNGRSGVAFRAKELRQNDEPSPVQTKPTAVKAS